MGIGKTIISYSVTFMNGGLLNICLLKMATHEFFSTNGDRQRRMRWAGHVARMGEERGCIGSCWGNRRERNHWGDLGVDGG